MHAVSANDLAFRFLAGTPKSRSRCPVWRTSVRILTGLVLRDAGRSHELEAPDPLPLFTPRSSCGAPHGGTNLYDRRIRVADGEWLFSNPT